MMPQCDYYAILNVSRDASENEIKRVYRQLALKYHPDKNPNDRMAAAKFRETTEAYEVLCDATERELYDRNNPPEPGRDVEYNLKVSHGNVPYGTQITLEQVTFEIKGRKIKMAINKNSGTHRLRGQGKHGAHGGPRGDLLVTVNVHKSDASSTFWAKDGAEMVLIPSGVFLMGSGDGLYPIETPLHTVYLDAFYMDKYEVTVGQYRQFLEATGHLNLPDWVSRYSPTDEHPVVGVSWNDAMAYAQWAGKRLPTEAEWEKAARGGLGAQYYGTLTYPWGHSCQGRFLPNANKANYDKNVGKTTPVGTYPPNGYGLYDMAGNVWEWCLDEYNPTFYANSPYRNPIAGGVSVQEFINNITNVPFPAVFRGAAWSSRWSQLSVSYRYFNRSLDMSSDVGFRCAMSVIP